MLLSQSYPYQIPGNPHKIHHLFVAKSCEIPIKSLCRGCHSHLGCSGSDSSSFTVSSEAPLPRAEGGSDTLKGRQRGRGKLGCAWWRAGAAGWAEFRCLFATRTWWLERQSGQKWGILLDLTKKKKHGDCDLYVILKDCLEGTSTTNIVLDPQTHGLSCIFSNQFWDKWICIAGWYGIQHPSRNTFICSPFLYIWQSMCLKFQITNRCII